MPEVQLPVPEIKITLPNKVIGSTIVKQLGNIYGMNYNLRSKCVVVLVHIEMYSRTETNDYGEYLGLAHGFQDYEYSLEARQDLVDMTTGDILGPSSLIATPESRAAAEAEGGPLFGHDYTTEFQRFFYVAETMNVNVNQMIRDYVNKLIASGFFGDPAEVQIVP